MTRSREFSSNPLFGIRRIFHGEDDGSFVMETRQETQPIVEGAAMIRDAQRHAGLQKFDPKKEFHQIASIPVTIFYDLKRRGILGGEAHEPTVLDSKAFMKWLHDSDNKAFRTHEGTVS